MDMIERKTEAFHEVSKCVLKEAKSKYSRMKSTTKNTVALVLKDGVQKG